MREIRPIEPDDWRVWRQLRLAALHESPDFFTSVYTDWQGPADNEQRWRDRLRAVATNFIAYVDETPVGMVSGDIVQAGAAVEVISLWVDPRSRGEGIGGSLVDAVSRWAQTHTLVSHVVAHVRINNTNAAQLFRRKRFHDTQNPDQTNQQLVRPLPSRIRIGLHSGQQYPDFNSIRCLWEEAGALGYDWISLFDHYRPHIVGPDGPCMDGPTLLSALSILTSSVRCALMVANPTWRHPALTAAIAATLDHVSGGRLEFGVGVGGFDLAFQQYGLPFPPMRTRANQLDEACRVLRLLWNGGPVDFSGEYYRLHDAYLRPRPIQRHVPLIVGGGGERLTLPLVARHADIWNTVVLSPSEYRRKAEVLEGLCKQQLRDPTGIRKSITFRAVVYANAMDARNDYRARIAPSDISECISVGTAEQCLERLAPYVDLGVRDFILAVRPPVDHVTVKLFIAAVAPTLRKLAPAWH